MTERYFREWDENTAIGWWNHGRKQLNKVVRAVNRWSLDGRPPERATRLLRNIDMGLQTFAAIDGGSGWAEELRTMRLYVESSTRGES